MSARVSRIARVSRSGGAEKTFFAAEKTERRMIHRLRSTRRGFGRTRWLLACLARTRVHADGAVRVRDGDKNAAERLIGARSVQRPLRVRGRARCRDLRGEINGHLRRGRRALVRVGPVPSALEVCRGGWTRVEPSLYERRLDPRTARPRPRANLAANLPCRPVVQEERKERTYNIKSVSQHAC